MPILYIRDELNQEWLPVVSELGAIPDVSLPGTITNGHALVYHSGSGVWTSGSVGSGTGGVLYLEDLLDVDAESPNSGDILQYNTGTSKWEAVPQSGSSGDMYKSIYDQDNDGIVDNSEMLGGQLPSYYALSSHSHTGTYAPLSHTHSGSDLSYVNATIIDGRAIDLTDVPTDGQALVWSESANKWQYTTVQSGSGGGNATQLQGRDIADTAPSDNDVLTWNSGASQWEPAEGGTSTSGSPEQRSITFYVPGYQFVGAKYPRYYFPFSSGSIQFTRCIGGLSVAPSGSSLIFKVRRAGYAGTNVDVCSVTIASGTLHASTDTISQPYWTAGFFLEVYVSQVGSTSQGTNLSVAITGRGIGLPT